MELIGSGMRREGEEKEREEGKTLPALPYIHLLRGRGGRGDVRMDALFPFCASPVGNYVILR